MYLRELQRQTKTNSLWIVLNYAMWNSLIFYHWYLIPWFRFRILCFTAATSENRCSHEKFKGKIHRFSLNCRFKTSLFTDRSIFSSKSVERAWWNINRGGFIDPRRKGTVVGEEENRRFIFSFSLSELVFARSTALNEKKKKTSVYRLIQNRQAVQEDNWVWSQRVIR